MTASLSVLILGNSHAGALRSAQDAFAAHYPEVELRFFAAPGASFKRARLDKDNIFHPKVFGDKDAQAVLDINGAETVDLNGFDHILVIGHRPGLFDLCGLAAEGGFGLLDEDSDAPHLLSRELVEDWLDRILDPWVEQMTKIFGAQKNLSFTDAPYRSQSMLDEKDKKDEAAQFARFMSIPFVNTLMEIHDTKLAEKLNAKGYGYLRQPAQTLVAPYSTDPSYCRGASNADGRVIESDHRHMNAAFGLDLLTEYATTTLDLPVRARNG